MGRDRLRDVFKLTRVREVISRVASRIWEGCGRSISGIRKRINAVVARAEKASEKIDWWQAARTFFLSVLAGVIAALLTTFLLQSPASPITERDITITESHIGLFLDSDTLQERRDHLVVITNTGDIDIERGWIVIKNDSLEYRKSNPVAYLPEGESKEFIFTLKYQINISTYSQYRTDINNESRFHRICEDLAADENRTFSLDTRFIRVDKVIHQSYHVIPTRYTIDVRLGRFGKSISSKVFRFPKSTRIVNTTEVSSESVRPRIVKDNDGECHLDTKDNTTNGSINLHPNL